MKENSKRLILSILLLLLVVIGAGHSVMANSKKEDWNGTLFEVPSDKYHDDLAKVAAFMCISADEEKDDNIKECYKNFGLNDIETYNYGDSAAFAIANDYLKIDGKDTLVLVITARGTKTLNEAIGDVMKGPPFHNKNNFCGTTIWNNVYDFEEKIHDGVKKYIKKHPKIKKEKRVKVLITGHSLGGAAVNAYAARINNRGIKGFNLKKEDIYIYTFGAIKVLTEDYNISDGYENIHNIYNYYDSFGPNGINFSDLNASSFEAKFGHTILYKYKHPEEKIELNDKDIIDSYISPSPILNIHTLFIPLLRTDILEHVLAVTGAKVYASLSNCTNHLMGSYYKDLLDTDLVYQSAKVMRLVPEKETIHKEDKEEFDTKHSNYDWNVGDIVTFGRYEQDGNFENAQEKIEWIVLNKKNDNVLLISNYILNVKPYYDEKQDNIWEESNVRNWLNTTFYNSAFSDSDKKQIVTDKIKNKNNNGVTDKIYFLSNDEVENYFNFKEDRIASLTVYAFSELKRVGLENGFWSSEENFESWFDQEEFIKWGWQWLWWLRSPGISKNRISRVDRDGTILYDGDFCNNKCVGVRPSIWVSTIVK